MRLTLSGPSPKMPNPHFHNPLQASPVKPDGHKRTGRTEPLKIKKLSGLTHYLFRG